MWILSEMILTETSSAELSTYEAKRRILIVHNTIYLTTIFTFICLSWESTKELHGRMLYTNGVVDVVKMECLIICFTTFESIYTIVMFCMEFNIQNTVSNE